MKNGDEQHGGIVTNLSEFGYDLVDKDGTFIAHITTGDVMCDLGVCEHEDHQHD
jgi:hypothetical protein